MNDFDLSGQEFDEKAYRDKSVLQELYCQRELSMRAISRMFGCSDSTVRRWLQEHDIPTRSRSESAKNRVDSSARKVLDDPAQLRAMYWGRSMTLSEIADAIGCGTSTVKRRLREHDIEARSNSESKIDDGAPWTDKDTLVRLYAERDLTVSQTAEELGCSQNTVCNWLAEFGIETRPRHHGTGEDHPRWKGGYEAPRYGPGWGEQRQKAIERDGCECVVCGLSETASQERYGQSLDVHHIRPLRAFDSTEAANRLNNLVTLCRACHRDWEGIPLRPEVVGDV